MVTIKHKVSGSIMDVTREKWVEMSGRSRNWEKIGEETVVDKKGRKDKAVFAPPGTENQEGILDWAEPGEPTEKE